MLWLIFVIVLLFTGLPARLCSSKHRLVRLFHFVLVGITLRGPHSCFANPRRRSGEQSHWGRIFGGASVITPVLLGMAVGAISSGRLRSHTDRHPSQDQPLWLAPVSLVIGALALALCAYLAAVYLTNETHGELQEDFRRRALLAGTSSLGWPVSRLPLVYLETPYLWDGLVGRRAAPVVALGVVTALLSGLALLRRRFSIGKGGRQLGRYRFYCSAGGWRSIPTSFIRT